MKLTKLLMVSPEHYDVQYAINPHMKNPDGSLKRVRRAEAVRQWEALKKTFEQLGCEVAVLEGQPGLPDMVFAANHGLPLGGKKILMGRMRHPDRQGEIEVFQNWYRQEGWEVVACESLGEFYFEGMGDALWTADRKRLLGGFGLRSSQEVYAAMRRQWKIPVTELHLVDPVFYHLDTCLAVLDESTVAWVESAFSPPSARLICQEFSRRIAVPREEALENFAANCYCPDRKTVVIQRGAKKTNRLLKEAGFDVVEVETSEFMQAGGSVFCLKMEF